MRPRGMTLAELMVVAAILLLLMAISVSFLVPGLRAWLRSESRSRAQQAALVVTSLLLEEVRHAHGGGISVAVRPAADDDGAVRRDAVCLLSSWDTNGAIHGDAWGETIWQTRVTLYHAGACREVRLRRTPLSPPTTTPIPLAVADFADGPRDRVVARGIRSMALSYDGYANLRISVEAVVDGYRSALETSGTCLLEEVYGGTGPTPSPSP